MMSEDGSGTVIACFKGDLGRKVDVVDAMCWETWLLSCGALLVDDCKGLGNLLVGEGGLLVLRLRASTEL
jgi:hypothetical protein